MFILKKADVFRELSENGGDSATFGVNVDGLLTSFYYLKKTGANKQQDIRQSKRILKKIEGRGDAFFTEIRTDLAGDTDLTKPPIKVEKLRSKMSISLEQLSEDVDSRTSERAFDPNLIQFFDARLCRFSIINSNLTFTIHDCFGLQADQLGSLYEAQSYYFQKTDFKSLVFKKNSKDLIRDSGVDVCLFILL
jgi:hypothetical protein